MKALYKLVRNGNATHITIPRPMLEHLRWRCGDAMIIELNEAGYVQVRPPTPMDMRAAGAPVMLDRSVPESAR